MFSRLTRTQTPINHVFCPQPLGALDLGQMDLGQRVYSSEAHSTQANSTLANSTWANGAFIRLRPKKYHVDLFDLGQNPPLPTLPVFRGGQTQFMQGWGPEGWEPKPGKGGARRVGGRAFFFLLPPQFSFFVLLGVLSWNFGGAFEGRDPLMCTSGLSGCRVEPRRPQARRGFTRQPAGAVQGRGGPGEGPGEGGFVRAPKSWTNTQTHTDTHTHSRHTHSRHTYKIDDLGQLAKVELAYV